MRPIDADAMRDTNNNVIAIIDPETKSKYLISLNDYINAQPTVDTIKHGHWKKGVFSDITCSNCGLSVCIANSVIPKMFYCPNCGARMDEDE